MRRRTLDASLLLGHAERQADEAKRLIEELKGQLAKLTLEHNGLEVDRLARVVRLNGQRRELSQVQFDLLVYLLLNRGRMLAAEELLPIFAKSTSHNKNMVEFHIFHLRRALWPELIRTVKGQGYTIDPESEAAK